MDDVITLAFLKSKIREVQSHDLAAFKHEIDKKFTELKSVKLENVSKPMDENSLKRNLLKFRTDESMTKMKSTGEELSK